MAFSAPGAHERKDVDTCTFPPIIYSNNRLIAVDKPAQMIVHGDGTGAETLTDLLRSRVSAGAVAHVSPEQTIEIQALNRLDRDTTGIVLFSCCKRTQGAYDALIAGHDVDKRYLAVAEGHVPWGRQEIQQPIGRDRHDARRMRISRTGKTAHTIVVVLDRRRIDGRWLSLLEVRLLSGRKHQIRVHLAHVGFPLVGDCLYGMPDAPGLMLHAVRLSFTDPISSAPINIQAPIPERICSLFPRSCERYATGM